MPVTEEQQLCIDTLDRPLVVAAGAGSGKTFTLTKRIVGAFQKGYISDIDEVCAITFTRKAAAELKSRLKGELRACGLVEQALKVDEAWVSTIHGMCARILRAHALELGIDPSFSVAEGAQVQAHLDRAIETVLVDAQQGTSSARLDALFKEYSARSAGGFGTSVESMLSTLVTVAAAQECGVDSFVMPGTTVRPNYAVELAAEAVQDVLVLAGDEKAGAKRDEWMAHAEEQIEGARAFLESGSDDPLEALSTIASFKLAKTFGGKEFKARVDEARGVLGSCVMEVRLCAAQEHLETLVELARQALAEFSRLKQVDGMLDNNDLLTQAAAALEKHPSIAARYSDKFKLVMVDEFQDTDQMQVDMIKRLAGEGAQRLCTVGDAQQSIYRFRGADVSVYRRHLGSVRAAWNDSVVELSANFRSHADVLSFVDRVFEQPQMFGGEFMSLSPGRDESRVAAPFESSRNRVILQHTSAPWRGVSSEDACRMAAQRIAVAFKELADAGHSAGEMAVLLGRMTNADVYAQALRDQGLSCVISGGSVFSRAVEAATVRELVRVIANPNETQSLFNVLTSPLFSLTAGDLLGVGRFTGFWKRALRPQEGFPDCSPQLACALRVMGWARQAAAEEPVSRIVERIVADSGWLTRLERDGAEGLASAGNVYKAIRMIKDVERDGACGPVSVMRGLEETIEGSKEAPGALSVSGGNSVRIMTIHASKGLEFPIVAVAEVKEDKAPSARLLMASLSGKAYLSLDLGRSVEGGNGSVSLDDLSDYVLGEVAGEDEFAAAVAEESGALHRRLAIRGYLAAGDEEEAKRLLYVAITRAKEAVVVSTMGKRTKANPLGIPKSALAGVFSALDPSGMAMGEGLSHVEFGGALPAVINHVCLEADDLDDGQDADSDGDDAENVESVERPPFFIPADEGRPACLPEAFRALREGLFSYSSIADGSKEGDLLARLEDRYAAGVDEGDANDCPAERGEGGPESLPVAMRHGASVSGASDEDGRWMVDEAPRSFDEDRATDLGTAFHRLAQYAVAQRGADNALAMPPRDRVDALCRSCNLSLQQRERLMKALNRWFGSDLAREMARMSRLDAEVPFIISLSGGDASDVFLEGEIDLLGFDEDGSHARIVDYKTGGWSGETQHDLQMKHVLQAACYAYAVLLQGVQSVEADFVRVERGCADAPQQPQCVRYRFEQEEVPRLAQAIAEAYAQAQGRSI